MSDKIGKALGVAQRDGHALDWIESPDISGGIKPDLGLRRDHVENVNALFRQEVVAPCAALETYVADAVLARIGPVVRTR